MPSDVGSDEALIGRTIAGKYRIEELVGAGAMGAVYKAKQTALDKLIAVKVLRREIQKDKQFALRFKREAKAASRLDHPNSLRVLDFGEEPDGLLYMAMEFLDGVDLFALHKRAFPIPAARVASILSQTLAALGVAHEQGVIHRDLKPENIMVLAGKDDEGNTIDVVKVCDFGIAKIVDSGRGASESLADQSGRLSTRGLIVGTPEYMSPEQGRGEPLDARADIYAMGVILYQLLTGEVPFEAENAIGVVLKHVTEQPRPPSEVRAGCDPRLEAIALKAMQKRKEDRFASAREMRAALRPLLDAHGSASSETGGSWSQPRMSPLRIETAATVQLESSAQSTPFLAESERKATLSSAAIEDVPRPQKRPSVVAVAASALVLGVGGAIAFFVLTRHPVGDPLLAQTAQTTQPTVEPKAADASASAAPAIKESASVDKPKPKNTTAVASAPPATKVEARDAAAAAPPETIDAERAHVSVVAVRAEGASDGAVRAAIDVSKLTSCYQAGLRSPAAKGRAFQQPLSIETDAGGTINYAAMPAPDFLASLQSCYVRTLIGAKIGGASNAKITVDLAFAPR